MEKASKPSFMVGDVLVGCKMIGHYPSWLFFRVKSKVQKSGAPRVVKLKDIELSNTPYARTSKIDPQLVETDSTIYTARWSKTKEAWTIRYDDDVCTLERLENAEQVFVRTYPD